MVLQVYVQYCAVNAVNTSMANANATPDGKARNAPCATTNAKYRTATAMDTASTENVLVLEGIKGSSVLKLTVHIPLVQVMGSVSKEHVSARRDGRDWTVPRWTRTRCSVCQIALDMATSTWIRKLALAMPGGRAKTVPKVTIIFFLESKLPASLNTSDVLNDKQSIEKKI